MLIKELFNDASRDIFREMELLDNEFGSFLDVCRPDRAAEFPAVNIYESADELVVTAELPGIDPEKIDISHLGNTLTLRGTRAVGDGDRFYRRERGYGEFERSIALPFAPEPDDAKAVYKNGVLTVTLRKPEKAKPKKIEIRTA